MKKILRKVIQPFLPTYEVTCTNYFVIPGQPVNKNQTNHSFEKGANLEAEAFYGKIITSDYTKLMAPVEVHLKKRGKTIRTTQFGPVDEVKKFNVVSKN